MAETTAEDTIKLWVVVEGDDPRVRAFEVTVRLQDDFTEVVKIIQQVYWREQQISIYGLRLYRGNVPFEQVGQVQFLDAAFLRMNRLVTSEWPSKLDVDEGLVHIIVRTKSRQLTDTPPPTETEFEQLIRKFNTDKSNYAQYVQANETSSTPTSIPRNIRKQQNNSKHINIGRPADRVWLPIVLYHPVFGRFLTRLQSNDPIDRSVYTRTRDYFLVSQGLYMDDANERKLRDGASRTSLSHLLGGTVETIEVDGEISKPDVAGPIMIKIKNEIDTGPEDPLVQVAEAYTRYWRSNACCCPSILIALAGPWMCIFGAIFLDRPVVQPLTKFTWMGDDPSRPSELDRVARVFDSLSRAQHELEDYYRTNNPSLSSKNPARAFPHLTQYKDSTGQVVRFDYRKAVCPEKAIFVAETIKGENSKLVIVKFVRGYNGDAHRLPASHGLASQLYDGTIYGKDQPGPEHGMIVMEFVEGEDMDSSSYRPMPRSIFHDIKAAMDLLHSQDYVFADLRLPNMMILLDSSRKSTGRPMLVGFDWCGKRGSGRYPVRINMTLDWHEGVGPGVMMDKQHDIHLLDWLGRLPMFRVYCASGAIAFVSSELNHILYLCHSYFLRAKAQLRRDIIERLLLQ